MGKYALSAQAPFTLIAPVLQSGSDPSLGPAGNPQIKWSTFTQQFFPKVPERGPYVVGDPGQRGTDIGLLTGTRTASGGTITVASNTFLGPTILRLGRYTLTTGVDFAVGATANDTATNLHAAIAALPEYAGSTVVAPVITVVGPPGPGGNVAAFHAEGVSAGNLTLAPATDRLAGGQPVIGPPTLG